MRITNLDPIGSATLLQELPVVDNNVTYKVTISQIKTLFDTYYNLTGLPQVLGLDNSTGGVGINLGSDTITGLGGQMSLINSFYYQTGTGAEIYADDTTAYLSIDQLGTRYVNVEPTLTSIRHDIRSKIIAPIVEVDGDLAIGLTTPSAKVHSKSNTGMWLESSDAGYGAFKFVPYSSTQAYSNIKSSDNLELRFGSLSHAAKLGLITSTNNAKFGINTSTPIAGLDIISEGQTIATKSINVEQITSGYELLSLFDDGTFRLFRSGYVFSNYGQVTFGGTIGNGQLTMLDSGSIQRANLQVSGSTLLFDTDILHFRSANGSSTHMYKSTTGTFAIGSTNTRGKFDLTSSSGVAFISGPNAGTSSGYNYILEAEDNNGLILGYNSVSSTDIRFVMDVFTDGCAFRLRNNGSSNDVMRFDTRSGNDSFINNGNFGVGTTTPSEKLEVNGNIKTAQPSVNGAGSWKLGKNIIAASSLDATQYIEVEVDGIVYKLALIS